MTDELIGAWMHEDSNEEDLLQFIDGYHTRSVYRRAEKKFIETRGGRYSTDNNKLIVAIEFDTGNNEQTRVSLVYYFSTAGDELTIAINGKNLIYKKIDDGSAPLAGVWHITSQMRDGKLVPIHRTGTRKTLKILSGTRFQWAAIDPGTKEFFGTGGGTYQFLNEKYTEHIEFFSKDSNRIGATLAFDGKLENGEWHHSGRSSKGEKIYEIWSRVHH
jgi:hypothetical protein